MPTMPPELPVEIAVRGHQTRDWAVWADWCPALRLRGVLAAGYTELGVGYQILRKLPDFPHIGACIEGSVEYFADRQWRSVDAGTVLIAPAATPHGSRRLGSASKSGKTAWVLFLPVAKRPSRVHAWDRGEARIDDGHDVRPLWWALQGLYVEANAARARGESGELAVGPWCDLVVAAAQRLVTEGSITDAPIRHVWEQVDADLGRGWSVDELASLAGYSPTHFRRQCTALFGRPPARQLAHLRMQRAAMLLSTTRDKLATIASVVGYDDVFAFSVAFKRWSGVAPSVYRDGNAAT